MSKSSLSLPADFPKLLGEIKARIQQAQGRAVLSVNAELVRLYWDIGRLIEERQRQEGWGAAVIPRLARALHNELPEEKGFSERNLKYMIRFYREYATLPIVQQPAAQLVLPGPSPKVQRRAAQLPAAGLSSRTAEKSDASTASILWSIPWFHHVILMERVHDLADRLWYMAETLGNGYCRLEDVRGAGLTLSSSGMRVADSPILQDARPRKFKFIGCEIIYREACYLAATGRHQVDVEFLRKGLHDLETASMVERVQAAVDAVEPAAGYEAILLGYARCNDGLVGVTARGVPLVIPRAHDCITFFFGSRQAYQRYFDLNPGTYYMTTGWGERNVMGDYDKPAYGQQGVMGKLGLTQSREELIAKYGEDNADFIAEMLGDWTRNYNKFVYLKMGVGPDESLIAATEKEAARRGWQFEQRPGEWGLLQKLFDGQWDEDFVIVKPGQKFIARNDERVLDAE